VSSTWSRRFAAACVVLVGASLAAIVVLAMVHPQDFSVLAGAFWATPIVVLLAGIGALIVTRHPENAIGPGMCLLATALAFSGVADAYVVFEAEDGGHLEGYEVAAWLTSWVSLAALFVPITVFFLICPDGQLPSARWRPVLFFDAFAIALVTIASALAPGPIEGYHDVDNPMALTLFGEVVEYLKFLGYLLFIPAIGLSGAALIHRFRRSRGRERQQLKWLAFAAVAVIIIFLASWPISAIFSDVWELTPLIMLCLLPLAIGVAILRHQLYDIDRILNRTLVYALLTATLGAMYLGVVVGLQAVFSSIAGGSDLAIVITTLLVAALFLPVRRRVQEIVDRRFNRRTYDAARTIDAFSARLRQQIDLDTLRYELLAVTEETMQPSMASVWLRRT